MIFERFRCRKQKAVIREFVSQLSDGKLARMLYCAEHGSMHFSYPDRCLLGLSGDETKCQTSYFNALLTMSGACEAESAYRYLGGAMCDSQGSRDIRLATILRDIMAERREVHEFIQGSEAREQAEEVTKEDMSWTRLR